MELNDIMKEIKTGYIFGGGAVASRIYNLISEEYKPIIKGFMVTDTKNNPSTIEGLKVFEIDDNDLDLDASVLVTLSESYHPEVYDNIKKRGFTDVVSVFGFYGMDINSGNNDVSVDITEYIDDKIDINEELIVFRSKMIQDYVSMNHAFGENRFYQSLPKLGIIGDRPSDIRINSYGLREYVNDSSDVLDIGCNVGFVDIELANYVNSIIGLEYNQGLVDTGCKVIEELGIENIRLICTDYNVWEKENNKTYDVVFSFAVHIWLDVTPKKYAEQVDDLLRPDGYLIFESQTYDNDKKYDEFISAFLNKGLHIIKDDMIKDDGITERRFVVLQKKQK